MRKKIISVLLAGTMLAMALAGCGTEPTSSVGDTTEDDAESEVSDEAGEDASDSEDASEDFMGSMEGITLKLGTSGTYAPFSYFAEDGTTLQGYDIDMIYALQEVLGFEIENDTISDMDYTPLTASVSEGQLDVALAALCATDTRKETMNFSDIYYDAGIIVAVAPDNEVITSVDDLTGGEYTVAIQSGTVAYEYAIANLPEECIQVFDSQALAYKAVEGGQADATIYDAPGTAYSISTGEINLKIVGDEFFNGQAPYAIAFSFNICEEYPDIIDNFNAAISYLDETGKLDEIKAEWCE